MDSQQVLTWFKGRTLKEMAAMIEEFKDIRRQLFNDTYTTVEIVNGAANISHLIRKITGFECYHQRGSYEGTCGYNIVLVPKELYTRELSNALVEYFSKHVSSFTSEGWHSILDGIINS